MKKYALYLADDCHQCGIVLDFIQAHEVNLDLIHLTGEELSKSDLFVFPTLKKEEDIVAYGIDIIDYLKQDFNIS